MLYALIQAYTGATIGLRYSQSYNYDIIKEIRTLFGYSNFLINFSKNFEMKKHITPTSAAFD